LLVGRYQSKTSPGYYNYATGTGVSEDPLVLDFNTGATGKNLLEMKYIGEDDSNSLKVKVYFKNNSLAEWYPLINPNTGSQQILSFTTSGNIEDLQILRRVLNIESVEDEIRLEIYSENDNVSGRISVQVLPCFRPTELPFDLRTRSTSIPVANLTVNILNNDEGELSWKVYHNSSYTEEGGTIENLGIGYQLIALRKIVEEEELIDYVYVSISEGNNVYTHTEIIEGSGPSYPWQIEDAEGQVSIYVDFDYATINRGEEELINATFVDDVLKIDLSSFEICNEDLGDAQEDILVYYDGIGMKDSYPVLQYESMEAPLGGDFSDIPVYTNTYPILQSYLTPSELDKGEGVWIEINTLSGLQNMANDLTANYYLSADIDASATSGWDGGDGFEPIGNDSTPFEGKFDGCGHTISNLTINRDSEDYVGLFGAIRSDAILNWVTLSEVSIVGDNYVGGIVGNVGNASCNYIRVNGTITSTGSSNGRAGGFSGKIAGTVTMSDCHTEVNINGVDRVGGFAGVITSNDLTLEYCSSSGNVSGEGGIGGFAGISLTSGIVKKCFANSDIVASSTNPVYAGGFFGYCSDSIDLDDCYSLGDVTVASSSTGKYVGGFIARITTAGATIDNCHCFGQVIATATSNVGGFIGDSASSNITSCYWNQTPYGVDYGDYDNSIGTPKTDEEMKEESTFVDWDFSSIWMFGTEQTGTIEWIEINNSTDLLKIGVEVDYPRTGYYYLSANIDLSSLGSIDPICGVSSFEDLVVTSFQGVFDGDGYTISGITSNSLPRFGVGLFGACYNAEIRNLHVISDTIRGNLAVGGFCGASIDSTIENIIVEITNKVELVEEAGMDPMGVGGFIGVLLGGNVISNVRSIGGSVIGVVGTGGLVGLATDEDFPGTSSIYNAYSNCTVVGSSIFAGGLVGYTQANVSYSYSCGLVNNGVYTLGVGGLFGSVDGEEFIITDCFWDIESSGQSFSQEGTGKTTEQMKQQSTFTNWDFDDIWEIGEEEYDAEDILIAHNGFVRIKIDLVHNKFCTKNAIKPVVNNDSEGTYFIEEGVLYFQLYDEDEDSYFTWLSIDGEDVYLPEIIE